MILIDANEANTNQPVGSNIFVQELLSHLYGLWSSELPQVNLLLSQPPKTNFFRTLKNWPLKILSPSFLWTQWRLPLYLFNHPPKIIFSPSHYGPRFRPSKTKSITTIFDLAFLHFPQSFTKKDRWQLKKWTEYSVKKADLIFTISSSTKRDIVKNYQISEEKIQIIYPGSRLNHLNSTTPLYQKIKAKYQLEDKKYLLFVGTLQPRKNIVNLLQAFLNLQTNIKLILVGRKGWLFEEKISPFLTPAIKSKRVIWLNFIPDNLLIEFYKKALFLILPSLWEGFGLPVVEAGYFSTPAIVSANSSLNELVKNPQQKIPPPFSVQEIQKTLERMIKLDHKEYEKLSKQAQENSQRFSWLKTAKKVKEHLLNLY